MFIVRTCIFMLCATGIVIASTEAREKRDSDVTIIKQWKERNVGAKKPTNKVIRTADDWEEAWKKAHAKTFPPPAVPEIDFDKQMVLAVYTGTKSTGGHSVEIKKVEKSDGLAKVYFREIAPAPGANKVQTRTSPACFAVVPKLDDKVEFVKEASPTEIK